MRELSAFVSYLKAKNVTIDVYNCTFDNEEERRLHDAVKSIVKQFWDALRDCDDGFFQDNYKPVRKWEIEIRRLPFDQQDKMGRNIFRMQMKEWKKTGGIVFRDIQNLIYRIWGG